MSGELDAWLARWGLTLISRPDLANGRQPYPGAAPVAFVERDGVPLVLKLLNAGSDEYKSAWVLRHWNGEGAVRLVEADAGVVLIERAIPGDDLTGLVGPGRDDEATLALCEAMAKLNRPAPRAGFRTVADWGQSFDRDRAVALASGMDGALIDRAEALFFDLCATQGPPILLHGDLQHFNVVRDAARGWLAIDPKGVLGEAAYETGAMLRNPNDDPGQCADPAVIARRVGIICERLGYPRDRVLGWAFSQWVLSILWAIEDGFGYSPDWLAGPMAIEAIF
jgi:streptomycin 6-kinase